MIFLTKGPASYSETVVYLVLPLY